MKHHFILNPAAGKGSHLSSLRRRIEEDCTAEGVDFLLYETKSPRDATEYVRSVILSGGDHRFYACGGDGTLCEVVNGAFDLTEGGNGRICSGGRIEFALIPIGTGNDFCRNFTDRASFFDIRRQLRGSASPIDLIRYGNRISVNMMNIGFDCNVVGNTERFKHSKLIPSGMAYISGVAVTLFHKLTTPMRIELSENEVIERPLLLITIANGRFCGGGFRSNPKAALNDGLLDINIIEKIGRISFLSLIASYKAGTHLEVAPKYVTYRQATGLTIKLPEGCAICIDGELEHGSELSISLLPEAALFVLPEGCSFLTDRETESQAPAEEELPCEGEAPSCEAENTSSAEEAPPCAKEGLVQEPEGEV